MQILFFFFPLTWFWNSYRNILHLFYLGFFIYYFFNPMNFATTKQLNSLLERPENLCATVRAL